MSHSPRHSHGGAASGGDAGAANRPAPVALDGAEGSDTPAMDLTPDPLMGVVAPAVAVASVASTPLETSGSTPLTWSDPAHITVAVVAQNLPDQPMLFSSPLPAAMIPLLDAAEHAWEAVANVTFDNIADTAMTSATGADIRVGLAALAPVGFIGITDHAWNPATGSFLPGAQVAVEDPQERPVTALVDGDLQYTGFQTTVFQDLLHEFGHAIGLAHNPTDPTSIMNPVLSAANPYIDQQDAAALRSIYGAPAAAAVTVSQTDPVLAALLPAGHTIAV